MSKWYTITKFLTHLSQSRRWDAFHSPFLFDLFTFCCDEKKRSPVFEIIESSRQALLSSKDVVSRVDYGAGSKARVDPLNVPVAQIAGQALSHPFQCRFLFRLATFLNPTLILEFGTSLGISTAYLAAGAPGAAIQSVEGDPMISKLAREFFDKLGFVNIELYNETFQNFIETNLGSTEKIDLLFLDGHHIAKALLHYYNLLKSKTHAETIIVVDDIYWSKDMNAGWNELIQYPEVTQSVDCFHFGLIFFKNDFMGKEHHKIRLPLRMLLAKK